MKISAINQQYVNNKNHNVNFQGVSENLKKGASELQRKQIWGEILDKKLLATIEDSNIMTKIKELMNQYEVLTQKYFKRKDRLNVLESIRIQTEKMSIVEEIYKQIGVKIKSILEEPAKPLLHKKGFGFDKIAGYDDMKQLINSAFFTEISAEKAGKKVDIPNAFMFFGPFGNGKTTFARAVAEQMTLMPETNCNLVDATVGVKTSLFNDSQKPLFNNIIKIAQNSKENFDKNGRTIIFLDEFAERFDQDPETRKLFSDFLSDCSDKYKVTMFMDTNHMSKHGLDLGRIDPVFVSVDMPDRQNTIQVLRYYLKDLDNGIDYEKTADAIKEFTDSKGIQFNNTNLRNLAKGASNIQTEKINTQKLIDYLNSKKFIDGEEIVEQSILDEFARDVKTFIN